MSTSTSEVVLENSPTRPSPTKRQENQKPSCVLLVCVYDTIVFNITNDIVYSRFEQFGNIIRLLIFQRKEVTKLFVEFEKETEALKAKQALDGKKLCQNICKMSIYFSTFENVDLKHQTTEGLDFLNEKGLNHDQQSATFSNKSPTKNLDDFDQFGAFDVCGVHRLSNLPENSFLPRSKTDIHEIQWHINKMKKQESHWSGLLYIDQTIKSDIDSILNGEVDELDKWSTNSQSNESPKKSPAPKIKSIEYKDENLTVLGFKTKNMLKQSYLYNLFSNFGNISLINVKRNEVRIKFRTVEFAAITKNYLDNTWLFGNKIQLNSFPSNACYPQEGEYCEITCYDDTSDRFTPKKSITINPPSKVLHISGMKKEKCTVYEITNIFRHVAEPTRIKILKQNADKNMALVEFSCLEDSFDAIAQCHNLVIGGRKVQISFTKSQI